MWLVIAWRARSLPRPVTLKRFFAPECDFIFGMGTVNSSRRPPLPIDFGRAPKGARHPAPLLAFPPITPKRARLLRRGAAPHRPAGGQLRSRARPRRPAARRRTGVV